LSFTREISWLYVIFWESFDDPGMSVLEARKTRRTMTISGKRALRKKRLKGLLWGY
jgi:hypothetical protein